MKLIILLLLAGTVTLGATAQKKVTVPDFKLIEKNINDKNSPFYYKTLLDRYQSNDTLLNEEEYRHLYYGFTFQPSYSPYGTSELVKKLKPLLEKENMSREDVRAAIDLEKGILKEYPFNLRNIQTLYRLYGKVQDSLNARLNFRKLIDLAQALLSSGTGLSDTSPVYVISVSHEYDLLSMMGYASAGQAVVKKNGATLDKLTLEKNDDAVEAMYFNVDLLFASMEKMFRKKD